MKKNTNWFALAGGIAMVVLFVVSVFFPWWTLAIGDDLAKINISPLNMSFDILGTSFVPPLIWAVNLAAALAMAVGATVMLIYAIRPQKSYSKTLLSYSYQKPIWAVIMFVVVLFGVSFFIQTLYGISIPIAGSQKVQIPQSLTQNVVVNVSASAAFEWPFWLAIAVAGICVVARLYHRRVSKPEIPQIQPILPSA